MDIVYPFEDSAPGEGPSRIDPGALATRALELIPGGSQTISKGPTQWVEAAPRFASHAQGPKLFDAEGRGFYDLPMALGPILLGHRHPRVDAAVTSALEQGVTFTLPHSIEVEVAELMTSMVPGAEMVRFAKSGSDVVSAAVRGARAVTGRDKVAFSGYHGWHDWHIGATSRSKGVPQAVRDLTLPFAFNDLDSLRDLFAANPDEIAAVVVEPASVEEPQPDFLSGVRELCSAHGTMLVFDEIVTGFRLARGGAQELYGVSADYVCFGKALANGLPLSALCGSTEAMTVFEEVFFSSTHGGEILSLAAARATLQTVRNEGVCDGLWRRGRMLSDRISSSILAAGMEEVVLISGAAPRTVVRVIEDDPEAAELPGTSLMQQELARRGVLFNGSNFICHAHSDTDIEAIADAYAEAIGILADAWPGGVAERVEGPLLAPVFRRIR